MYFIQKVKETILHLKQNQTIFVTECLGCLLDENISGESMAKGH